MILSQVYKIIIPDDQGGFENLNEASSLFKTIQSSLGNGLEYPSGDLKLSNDELNYIKQEIISYSQNYIDSYSLVVQLEALSNAIGPIPKDVKATQTGPEGLFTDKVFEDL